MNKSVIKYGLTAVGMSVVLVSCKSMNISEKQANDATPSAYSNNSQDTTNAADLKASQFFTDPYLVTLIDTALAHNQELNIVKQEILMSQNEILAKKGEYLPFVGLRGGAGAEKAGRYTVRGAGEKAIDIAPNTATPEAVPDLILAAYASWEVDIWHKLRNAKAAAAKKYLASVEGKNFLVTTLIGEIANSYYELLSLDNQLEIVKQNIEIQSNALDIVRQEKLAGRTTELAVKKFEAEVFYTKSLQFDIAQQIVEAQNRINFLVGRFPQPVQRASQSLVDMTPATVPSGIPSQLLRNRPDIRQAEFEIEAAKLNLKSARANFYPSFTITGSLGLNAFNPKYFVTMPESIIFSLIGDAVGPLINRNALKATYYNASAKQIQTVYNYERSILTAYIEVSNQMSNIDNLNQSYDLKRQQVDALNQSINILIGLYKNARADYMEVLMTQRDALAAKIELVEMKKSQMNAMVNMYRALGGGWK